MKRTLLSLIVVFIAFCGCLTNSFAKDGDVVNVSLVNALSSTVTVAWNVNGCSDVEAAQYPYEIALYTAPDCTDESLFVSWLIRDMDVWTVKDETYVRFTFSGLSADTPYWVKVAVIGEDSLVSEPFEVRTAAFNHNVTATDPGTAKVGDVLIAEDFSKLVHGGDMAFKAAGVGTSASYRDGLNVPKGKNPTNLHLRVQGYTHELNFFIGKGVSKEYTEGTGLSDWCIGLESNVSTRPGYAKVGGGKGAFGYFATPELSAIPDGKSVTVRVDFSAMPYFMVNTSQCRQIMVGVVDKVKVWEHQVEKWTTTYDGANFKKNKPQYVPISQDSKGFHDYSVTLSGVTNKSRIRFSSDEESNLTRFLLNYVVVTIIEE